MPKQDSIIGVIGAGTMGSGIAQKFAMEGYNVVLVDKSIKDAERGLQKIRDVLTEGVKKKVLTEEEFNNTLRNITLSETYDPLKNALLIIEAVFENFDVKKTVFKKLAKMVSKTTILATNTSSYKVEDIAEGIENPERVCGLHYFFHPAKNKLVEIIGHRGTSQEVLSKVWGINQAIGKIPIQCRDAFGFVVNRFFVPFANEATRLLQEQVATLEEIEAVAMHTFHIGMGPFKLLNVTGVPITFHAATTLGKAFGKFYHPTDILSYQVEKKEDWRIKALPTQIDPHKEQLIQDHLLGAVFLICGELLDEKVCSKEDCNLGAKTGLLWEKGPFELMNHYGVERSQAAVETFAKKFKVKIPISIQDYFKNKRLWRFLHLKASHQGSLGRIILTRPDRMNALDMEVLEQLDTAFESLERDPAIETIIIETIGKTFVAGADLKFFQKNLIDKNHGPIMEFIEMGQKIFNKIDQSNKLVIAKLQGPSFGGGTELALAADVVIISDQASMSLPETGLGIIPGWGGTQRTCLTATTPVGKYLVYSGLPLRGKEAVDLALAEYCSPPSSLEDVALAVAENANRLTKRHRDAARIPANMNAAIHMFEYYTVDQLLDPKFKAPDDPISQKALKAVRDKSPNALRTAERAINEGRKKRELLEALRIEVDEFKKTLSHPDALEGVSAFAEKRKPIFKQ